MKFKKIVTAFSFLILMSVGTIPLEVSAGQSSGWAKVSKLLAYRSNRLYVKLVIPGINPVGCASTLWYRLDDESEFGLGGLENMYDTLIAAKAAGWLVALSVDTEKCSGPYPLVYGVQTQ